MKHRALALAFLTAGLYATACGDEDLKSGPVCPGGQEQRCEGDGEKLRCACVKPDAGSDAADAGGDSG